MLASPIHPQISHSFSPQHNSEDPLQGRPSRDLESFNSLLPPPIEFIEGSSSGALATVEGKYEPINATPKAHKSQRDDQSKVVVNSPSKLSATTPRNPTASLFQGDIDLAWPPRMSRGTGLYNTGNTCFLNSTLQCLLHTPPLLRLLTSHISCRVDGFCMTCALRKVALQSHSTKSAFAPSAVTQKLQLIAKNMRRGRQEDSHEFLRYAIDALQKSCLAEHQRKTDPKLAETTWVHKLFGGKLRSRVSCKNCGHNSDTFDSILDLSLDIHRCSGIKEALRNFVAPDHLKGDDKYKCEKCKKYVNAEKKFSLHEPPVVLTVHLKRFSPLGLKIGHLVNYDESLSLGPYMSEGQYGPNYSLYGVICHAGGGPHSGHYYAYVKSSNGSWYEMNDETASPHRGPATRIKNAYILFYLRNKGDKLQSAIQPSFIPPKLVAGMKKRKASVDDENVGEDTGAKVSKTFIGPLLPTATTTEADGPPPSPKRQKLNDIDPQADTVKRKIVEANKKSSSGTALSSLDDYHSDTDEPETSAMEVDVSPSKSPVPSPPPSSPAPSLEAAPARSSEADPSTQPKSDGIPPTRFYGASPKIQKVRPHVSSDWVNKSSGFNPFTRVKSKSKTYGKRTKARGI